MNTKTVALAGVLLISASATALAQAPITTTPATPAPGVTTTQTMGQIQTDRLIGTNVQNFQNETIGEIKSVALGTDGSVDAVIVGVGGFLGLGEREVALAWRDLRISDGGARVAVNMTRDQLAAMPAYRYANVAERGTVFRTTTRPLDAAGAPSTTRTVQVPVTPMRDGAAMPMRAGFMTASKLVGLDVYDMQNNNIGEIKDVIFNTRGEVERAILSVGGVLGIGARDVGVDWRALQFRTDGDDLRATVAMNSDQLRTMPEYHNDRGAWVVRN